MGIMINRSSRLLVYGSLNRLKLLILPTQRLVVLC